MGLMLDDPRLEPKSHTNGHVSRRAIDMTSTTLISRHSVRNRLRIFEWLCPCRLFPTLLVPPYKETKILVNLSHGIQVRSERTPHKHDASLLISQKENITHSQVKVNLSHFPDPNISVCSCWDVASWHMRWAKYESNLSDSLLCV
jgi:hypothetical protein